MAQSGAYPVTFTVDYPDRELNRLTTAFRTILGIPVLLLAIGRVRFHAQHRPRPPVHPAVPRGAIR